MENLPQGRVPSNRVERTNEAPMVDPSMQKNIDAFFAQLDGLLPEHAGKYVVFADSHLFKVCNSLASALSVAYANFGTTPFLVQRVEQLRSHVDFQATCPV